MADNLIQKKGESTWYVRLAVPADVQKAIGCKVLIQSLKTGLRKEAMDARLPVLTKWKAQFQAARDKRTNRGDSWKERIAQDAQDFSQITRQLKIDTALGETKPTNLDIDPAHLEELRQFVFSDTEDGRRRRAEADAVYAKHGLEGEIAIHDLVHKMLLETWGGLTAHANDFSSSEAEEMQVILADPTSHKVRSPITTARLKTFKEFRESRGGAPKHIDQQVGKMERLSEFLKKDGLPLTFDTVDVWLKSLDRAPATLSQYLMAGTAFWKWAMKYDAGWRDQFKDKVNPFVGHELPQGGGAETAGKDREIYTKADTLKLQRAALDNDDQPLADLIALGWYTGARIEELCRLTKDSVITIDGVQCFDFPRSKSKASKRVVPIHPSLLSTVDRLVKDSTDTFLIPAESADKYGKRSHAISKAFGRLRTAAGFSRLHVFHSFRHTVVTELIRADVPDALAKELVGHETGSVTHDVYSKGASTKQKLAAITKLPALNMHTK
ncbi:site-specific integrase [Pseudomonas sp. S1Bt30]|uniref:Site-specific integrase n=1 Tax=Pseudomonas quebecensis TaxID=2995174 RepID=A0ABY6QKL0_9PSED|nr:site-specific integrase [Pseudomonas quebecensis]MCX4064275.1 site-specific integrase [Pseudomonas quebecensis]UZW19862.1 site-specific integrase [Pseudomonas quebecensis]UZW22721.1 site-specific integrase [Pseudomonas quebecensis]UZW27783.1 site-specific integrase [Pseudomonas quebecensis]